MPVTTHVRNDDGNRRPGGAGRADRSLSLLWTMPRKQLVSMPLGVAMPIPMHDSTGITRTIFRSWSPRRATRIGPIIAVSSQLERLAVPSGRKSMTSGIPASRRPAQIWLMDSDMKSVSLAMAVGLPLPIVGPPGAVRNGVCVSL